MNWQHQDNPLDWPRVPVTIRASDSTSEAGYAGYVNTGRGSGQSTAGIFPPMLNARTGMGTTHDKDAGTGFRRMELSRYQAETLYQMSWAAGKFIDMPVDDMFIRGRSWTGQDESAIEAMEDVDRDLGVHTNLANAMKAGRLFGTGMVVIVPENGDLESEIEPEDIGEGGIANLWVVDRWSITVDSWVTNLTARNYGQPYTYLVNQRIEGTPASAGLSGSRRVSVDENGSPQHIVNHTRCLRFDGIRSPVTEGWWRGPWHREWGISELIRAFTEIHREAANWAGVGHLIQESSIFTLKVQDFKDSIKGRTSPAEATLEEIGERASMLKSIFRTMFIDAEDEAERITYNFAGLADLLDRHHQLLAAIGGIPVTRFMGQSPVGMNATGASDSTNYGIMVASLQNRLGKYPLHRLDRFVAAHAGLSEPPEYEWVPLFDLSEAEQGENFKSRTEAILAAFEKGVIDEDEARERLSEIEGWGELGPFSDDMRESQLERLHPPPPEPSLNGNPPGPMPTQTA